MFAQKLLVCACAAIVVSVAAADVKCSDEASYGICPASTKIKHASIPPGESQKIIPVGAECENDGGVSGVKAIACDYDVAPSVVLASQYEVQVFRRSDLRAYVGVTYTVCCYN